MRLRVRVYSAPKAGSSEDEYEDAFWPVRDIDDRLDGFRCALADGATESSFSGQWARLLVRAYCRRELDGRRMEKSLSDLGRNWRAEVSAGPLPWYAEQKLDLGAFSSLLGLHIYRDGGWRAVAVGDTCVFQHRGENILRFFPVERADDFTSSPVLISSVGCHNRSLGAYTAEARGEWQRGDVFLLMTDAIACWYLRCIEEGHRPMAPVRRPSFRPWLSNLRSRGVVRNDDTTVMRVEML